MTKNPRSPSKSLVVTFGPRHPGPWWWQEIKKDDDLCTLEYERISSGELVSQALRTSQLPLLSLRVLLRLWTWRKRYKYVFTFECDAIGFILAFWQTLLGIRRPRHVILQFIMRERQHTFGSQMKYWLMKRIFSSVHRVVVSSEAELTYYAKEFDWPKAKLAFVPLHTSPEFANVGGREQDGLVVAAGRSFRDYETLAAAMSGTGLNLTIVGGAGVSVLSRSQSEIEVYENISPGQFVEILSAAQIVVVPLFDREISIGQSVILQGMAMGKLVIATETAGTRDYIRHMENGILVSPGNVSEMRAALIASKDPSLRRQLGSAAKRIVLQSHMPAHYAKGVRESLQS